MDTVGSPIGVSASDTAVDSSSGAASDEVVVETKDLRRHAQRVRQAACQYDVDRMKLVFEGGNDPKVAAAASDAPEHVLVLLRASSQQLSVGGRHVGG